MHVLKSLCLLLMGSATLPLLADEQRQHDAHVHGSGKLDIAQEGGALYIALDSPAVNVVGFEHEPSNQQELEIVKKALARLKDGASLFALPQEAGCHLVNADADTPLTGHDHDEEHHSDLQEDEHGHGDSNEHDVAHADVTATWQFSCAHPEALNRLGVRLFGVFPGTGRLQVQFITEERQGAAELSASQPELRF